MARASSHGNGRRRASIRQRGWGGGRGCGVCGSSGGGHGSPVVPLTREGLEVEIFVFREGEGGGRRVHPRMMVPPRCTKVKLRNCRHGRVHFFTLITLASAAGRSPARAHLPAPAPSGSSLIAIGDRRSAIGVGRSLHDMSTPWNSTQIHHLLDVRSCIMRNNLSLGEFLSVNQSQTVVVACRVLPLILYAYA